MSKKSSYGSARVASLLATAAQREAQAATAVMEKPAFNILADATKVVLEAELTRIEAAKAALTPSDEAYWDLTREWHATNRQLWDL